LGLIAASIALVLDRRIRAAGFQPWAVVLDARVARSMALFGAASLVANFVHQGADLLVRSALIRAFDAAQNGIYQSATSLLNPVKTIVLSGVSSYSLARLSSDPSQASVVGTANRLLSVIMPVAALAFGLVGLFSGPGLIILFSPNFLPAQALLPF